MYNIGQVESVKVAVDTLSVMAYEGVLATMKQIAGANNGVGGYWVLTCYYYIILLTTYYYRYMSTDIHQ